VGNTPSTFERRTANQSVDAWVDAHAPTQANPFQPTANNVMDGSMTYDKNCAFCHGNLKQPESPMHRKFYPSAPQLMTHIPDDPDGHVFYVIKYGIRYTGMPAGWRAERRRYLEDRPLHQEFGTDEGQRAATEVKQQLATSFLPALG